MTYKRTRSTRLFIMKSYEEMEREMEEEAWESEEDDRLRAIERFESSPPEVQWQLLLRSLARKTVPWCPRIWSA